MTLNRTITVRHDGQTYWTPSTRSRRPSRSRPASPNCPTRSPEYGKARSESMADWKLFCEWCPFTPPADWTMEQTRDHQVRAHPKEHAAGGVTMKLVPLCTTDGAPYEISESGDSGQCPLCGTFEILRVPDEFR